jgi:O-antigen/teichoic acid export membrane protein
LVVLGCSAIAEVFNAILGQPLIAAHKMWWKFGFELLFAVLLVGLAWMLIPRRGALGLAAAYLCAYALAALALSVFGRRQLWTSFGERAWQLPAVFSPTGYGEHLERNR